MRKRPIRKTLIVVCVIVVLAVVIAAASYYVLFHMSDPEEKAAIDSEMEKITLDILGDMHAEGSNVSKDEDNEEDSVTAEMSAENHSDVNVLDSLNTAQKTINDIGKIISLYQKAFMKLEEKANVLVVTMVDDVKEEYDMLKQNGAGKSELLKLAARYSNRAKSFESSMDSSVETLLAQLENDLVNVGAEEKEIDAIVNEFMDTYTREKEKRREEILDKAKSYL